MKKTLRKLGAAVLALTMVVSVITPVKDVHAQDEAAKISFENVSGSGEDKITLTDKRTFEAVVTLPEGTTKSEATKLAKNAKWSLSREHGVMDTKYYPYQFLGGSLSSWKVFGTTKGFFYNVETVAEKEDGAYVLKLTFDNRYMFGADGIDSRPRRVRSAMLDYVGDYTLTCKSGDKELGKCSVEVTPYDSYRLNSEYAKELNEAVEYAAGRDDLYAEVRNMGKTANGLDMPYILISDSKKSLDNWEKLARRMEENPEEVIAELKSGKLDYRLPVLYSNVHADENPGADAPMNFIWDIIKSDKHNNTITYKYVTGFKKAGKARLEKEMKAGKVHWSELYTKLENGPTGLGFIQDGSNVSDVVQLEKYYKIKTIELDVKDVLSKIFFIVCPEENGDARTLNIRHNGNGFDLNRDNMYQTQVETQNMTAMIAHWNPSVFIEMHGFVEQFQIEPCTPTHEPNIDYDLFIENAIAAGEAFGCGAIANNSQFQSFRMPARDYLTEDGKGKPYWDYVWDDMSSSYTPQYALLHGCVSFTIEVPEGNEEATKALEYGLISEAKYCMKNADKLLANQLEVYRRGVNGEDAESVRPYYVNRHNKAGAEADVFRPRFKENNNFFPEYYVIPVDGENQQDMDSAYEMQEHLLRNGVKVATLDKDTEVNGKTYKAGTIVVDMHQAKRNVANNALYDCVLITGWEDLYSEPITAFSQLRGFDMDVITTKDAFKGKITNLTKALTGSTYFEGEKDGYVIISNNSVDAVKAVNTLLNQDLSVGYINAECENKGDFVTTYENFLKVKGDFVLQAKGVSELPGSKLLNKATLYVAGKALASSDKINGKAYGLKNYDDWDNPPYNWDLFAYGKQMGFNLTTDLSKADMVVGSQPLLRNKEKTAIKNGMPWLVCGMDYYYGNSLNSVKEIVPGFDYSFGYWSIEDALAHVKYVDESMVTDKYVQENDTIMYGYGGHYISKVPKGAKVLIKVTKEDPLEGFMKASSLKKYKGSVQAIEYKKGKLDVTVFANTLTNKCHQQDDYRYASNTIFKHMLGATCTTENLK